MALKAHALSLLKPHLKDAHVLSLGYPDILATRESIEGLFGHKVEKMVTYRYEKTPDWKEIPDTHEVFKASGVRSITYVDIKQQYGVEDICDLNIEQDLGKYDVVIDPGTLEHCFNVGTAFKNAANAVRKGGVIYHENPASMTNHGFFNFCPTLYMDFYTQNNFELMRLVLAAPDGYGDMKPEHGIKTFKMQDRSFIVCKAKRLTDDPIKFPMQRKYL